MNPRVSVVQTTSLMQRKLSVGSLAFSILFSLFFLLTVSKVRDCIFCLTVCLTFIYYIVWVSSVCYFGLGDLYMPCFP